MRFSDEERAALLAAKGVGPKVVERLEQLGISDFAALAGRDPREVCRAVSAMLGSACWGNSPQARAAVAAAVAVATASRSRERVGTTAALQRRHP